MLRPGQVIALCVLALLTLGVVMVNSAGMGVDRVEALSPTSILLSRPTTYMVLAMLALVMTAFLPVRRLVGAGMRGEARAGDGDTDEASPRFLAPGWFGHVARAYIDLWPLWVGVVGILGVLAMVYVPGLSREMKGSHRWVNLRVPGLDSMQPSEIAKWGLVVVMAWYGARSAPRMGRFWTGLIPGLIAAGLVAGFIVLEDLGTGALIGLAACVVLIAAGAKIWHLLVLMPVPLAAVTLAIVTSEYRQHRIMAFIDPYREPQTIGYHMIQSMVAVANGEVFGRGLGHGLQKFGYLPEDTTDFLFAVICEELGVAGATMVVALYAGLLWAAWSIIRREQNPMLKLLGIGVVATVGFQAVINLAVVTGLGPTKGIALPLLSSGGTGWILTAASLGLLVAMDRSAEREDALPARLDDSGAGDEPRPLPRDGAVVESHADPEAQDEFDPVPAPVMATASANEDAVRLAADRLRSAALTAEANTPLLFADPDANLPGPEPAPQVIVTPGTSLWAGPTVRPA